MNCKTYRRRVEEYIAYLEKIFGHGLYPQDYSILRYFGEWADAHPAPQEPPEADKCACGHGKAYHLSYGRCVEDNCKCYRPADKEEG